VISTIDNLFPWFGDMVQLGGNILLVIVGMAMLIGTLVLERLGYLRFVYPRKRDNAIALWQGRDERGDWYSQHLRNLMMARLQRGLMRNVDLIRTLIRICPLLGLLGTVLGMLEVFDAVAATGTNNARSTASGVSKATVTTMAGMVVAIASLPAINLVSRRLVAEGGKLHDQLDLQPEAVQETSHA
jgi:biopolymer transport protein ExbB